MDSKFDLSKNLEQKIIIYTKLTENFDFGNEDKTKLYWTRLLWK